jgi:hypothetical protein
MAGGKNQGGVYFKCSATLDYNEWLEEKIEAGFIRSSANSRSLADRSSAKANTSTAYGQCTQACTSGSYTGLTTCGAASAGSESIR